jgi:hypothetical protein
LQSRPYYSPHRVSNKPAEARSHGRSFVTWFDLGPKISRLLIGFTITVGQRNS